MAKRKVRKRGDGGKKRDKRERRREVHLNANTLAHYVDTSSVRKKSPGRLYPNLWLLPHNSGLGALGWNSGPDAVNPTPGTADVSGTFSG